MAAKLNHWFASSAVYWRVASTVADLVREMDRLDHHGSSYGIYKVPLPLDAHYMIERRVPVVDGVEFVETVTMTRRVEDDNNKVDDITDCVNRFLPYGDLDDLEDVVDLKDELLEIVRT